MSENSKYREMFVQEALEHVENLNRHLLQYEEEPSVRDHIDILFRSAHTLKGMAATMQYDQIRDICKAIEEIFDGFRNGEMTISSELGNVLLLGIDHLRNLVPDEAKRVDLEEFLNYLKNPGEFRAAPAEPGAQPENKTASPTVRVKMQLDQVIQGSNLEEGREILMNLGRLITDLQYQTMKIRLVPIEHIFNMFSRMVRDVSHSLGKEVNLEIQGSDIELDRTVLDAISDPLLHMLRNAIDHGLETPTERVECGKPEMATILLKANRVGDRVEIQVVDDGRGIDLDAIKRKALERKLISEDEINRMSEEEIVNLIGTPGLSTAKEVTDISGRGVGMDVVLTQVKNVGGQVKISTKKGEGTSIVLTIPMSLAIIGGLLVNISDQKFVLPLSSISTTITANADEIKSVHGREVISLRGEVIPIVRAARILGFDEPADGRSLSQVNIVVVEKEGKSYGLVVDSLEKEQEVVIKRMEGMPNSNSSFSDATILPDGKVALILEPSLLVSVER